MFILLIDHTLRSKYSLSQAVIILLYALTSKSLIEQNNSMKVSPNISLASLDLEKVSID